MIDVVVIGGVFREFFSADANTGVRLGGSGLIAALVAARLAARTTLVSYVGDEDADWVRAILAATGVDDHSLLVLPGASGTFVFPANESTARPWPMYRPAEAVPSERPFVPPAKVYAMFGIPDFDPVAEDWLVEVDDSALLLWDRQGWLSRARDASLVGRLSPQRKVYLANVEEARAEFPADDERGSMAKLPPPGFSAAVVKKGPDGCVVIDGLGSDRTETAVAGFPVQATVTVGSGDVFAGALAAGLAFRASLRDAAVTANAAASAYLSSDRDALGAGFTERITTLAGSPGGEPSGG